ncbi:MAG: putative exodeoxyribonuclease 8 [Prokaryotic dsDNA virus sp.]|nr:MAG: putative exodeoxyribonuclease 8 [Prokaryotic dsDNA virus sp.]QDP53803.1 MAG: putative exodeoxyribonuclease 8 [Prokaryotic dsDNA virus sp.]|tara:strand:+ start:11606 stop:12385 length:780 start_codon:yes stop_codon:yes gene_type:complete
MKKYEIKIIKSCYDSNADYHSNDSISASGLKEISKTNPSAYLNKQWQETVDLAIGTAIHTAILEPEKFSDEIYVMPDLNLRTKAGKEEKEQHIKDAGQKTVISETNYDLVKKASESFSANKKAVDLLKESEIEKSYYGQINGIHVRCRPDMLGKDFICDLKSCRSIWANDFRQNAKNMRWFLQAVFYSDFLSIPAENFRFIGVSKDKNPKVEIFGLTEKHIDLGRWQWQEAFDRWFFYKETGVCPGEYWNDFDNEIKLI